MSIRDEFKTIFEHWQENKTAFLSEMVRTILVFLLLYALATFTYIAIFTAAQEHLRPRAVDFWRDIWPNWFAAFGTVFTILGGTPLMFFGVLQEELIPLARDPHLTADFTMLFFFLAFLMVAGLFGMGREIIDTAGTYSQGVVGWVKKKFIPYVFGALMFVVIGVLPAIGIGLAVTVSFDFIVPTPVNLITILIMIMVLFFAWGFLSMYFPAVSSGEGMIKSLKQTFTLTLDNFVRIFKVWTIYFVLIVIWFLPMSYWQNFEAVMKPKELIDIGNLYVFSLGWNFLYGLLVLFILVPMMTMHLSRLYAQITGKDVY